jgi:hypothetical protein
MGFLLVCGGLVTFPDAQQSLLEVFEAYVLHARLINIKLILTYKVSL